MRKSVCKTKLLLQLAHSALGWFRMRISGSGAFEIVINPSTAGGRELVGFHRGGIRFGFGLCFDLARTFTVFDTSTSDNSYAS